MTTRPSHRVFVVEDREDGSEQSGYWTRVGAAWPHSDGRGLNVQIIPGVSISGRLVDAVGGRARMSAWRLRKSWQRWLTRNQEEAELESNQP